MRLPLPLLMMLTFLTVPLPCSAQPPQGNLREQASAALKKATVFFRNEVSTEGGYLWRYSADLARREGEGRASASTVWVQPPGTPTVGMAFLDVYHQTGEGNYLNAARAAGMCLVRGQLDSGGWDYRIEFDPQVRRRYAYRIDSESAPDRLRNTTTLDDNTTQAALRLLIRLDEVLQFRDEAIHTAVMYALDCLQKAQYPNGGWPQRYAEFPQADKFPVRKASYPKSWSRTWPGTSYRGHYTFNDNAIADVVDVMFLAARVYDDEQYAQVAQRAGDFILLAQMPEPQPAWAQQYDIEMHPAWARKFEPPSITGGESFGVMRTLMRIYRETGKRKYLEPIDRALAYFRRSTLDDGRLARFYELKTNRPLYFTTKYKLTYSDDDLPTHYGFIVSNQTDRIEREYQQLISRPWQKPAVSKPSARRPSKASASLIASVKDVLAAQDERGAWVEEGQLKYHGPDDPARKVIDTRTFIRNIITLGAYLATEGP